MRGSAFSGIRVNEDERVDTEKPGLAEGEHRGMRDGLEELKSQLRQLRAERRLSMSGLELRAGLGHTTVSKALNGPTVPSEATVGALAQALGAEAGPLLKLRRQALPAVLAPPRQQAPKNGLDGDVDARFEGRYRRYVEQRHGQLSVIGLDLSRPERASWPLDASYLSLEFATSTRAVGQGGSAGFSADSGLASSVGSGAQMETERAEQALAGLRRVLVRGMAGGGKSTLLQWLALATAREDLPVELANLKGLVPFMLPLRTLVRGGDLPGPQEYLRAVGCPLHAAQPQGWTDRVLDDGRALLLIDGLDEIPQTQRAQAQQWLRELLAAFPRATYVVTTRPSAVPEGWLAGHGFTELTVRPMSARDVAVFVTRWHTAARASADPGQEFEHLAALEEALKDTVRSQRDLARLATTPLLCALVCALNRDRRGHLPHGRMELYEAALSLLLVRRDRERDIDAPENLVVTEHQNIQLLQRLAYWLVRNGQTELDRETALALIDDALPAMPNLAQQGDAADVLAHLLARSGLLRTPAAETIDFVHRTFQDFLGAKAAIEARDIPLLVRNAHDDQWEDVVRMAVAHARPNERTTLLRRLIARGDRTQKHRTRLHLLATACLEYATELDPEIRQEVEQRAKALVPPRSEEEARTLAAVGPVILDVLPGPEGLEEDEARAVVKTAELIGGDAALTLLKKFRTSYPAWWALSNAWKSFDAHDYAHEVLAHMTHLEAVTISSREELAELHHLPSLDHVAFIGDFSGAEMTTPWTQADVRVLNIHRNPTLRDLDFLHSYTGLKRIAFFQCPNVAGLKPLAELSVDVIELHGCGAARLEDLKDLTGLRELGLSMELPNHDLGALPTGADLTRLALGPNACAQLTLSGITSWPNLNRLDLSGPVEGLPQAMVELPELRDLILANNAGLFMLEQIPTCPQITELYLGQWRSGDDLALVRAKFPGLQDITIWAYLGCRRVDLTPLRGMPDLRIRILHALEVVGAEHFPPESVIRTPRPR
ncbi:NACHT domain-containing protein [Streptomyces sp. NBC_00435]|uniref:NACHT domain-containing protein n=1 Tax=Streptomyces sp. NBC_00435 TaxID=2903649 RepID=UPI002E235902